MIKSCIQHVSASHCQQTLRLHDCAICYTCILNSDKKYNVKHMICKHIYSCTCVIKCLFYFPLGSDTTRRGVTRVFNMFQHRALNKRLVYVIFEGMLTTLFPDHSFPEVFQKIHSGSPTAKEARAGSGGGAVKKGVGVGMKKG